MLVPARQCRQEVGTPLSAAVLLAAVILVYAFDRGGIASGYFIRGTCDSLAVVAIAPGAIIVHPVIRGFLEGDQS